MFASPRTPSPGLKGGSATTPIPAAFEALPRETGGRLPLVGLKGPWAEDQRLVTNVFDASNSIALLNGEAFCGPRPAKIIYTVWESTRLPDDWRQPMAAPTVSGCLRPGASGDDRRWRAGDAH